MIVECTDLSIEEGGIRNRGVGEEMGKRSDSDYIAFDPFSEDRDVDIQCHKVDIVTTRKEHWCSAGCLIDNDHNIPLGQRVRRERAKVDGQFGTCYQCLPCLDKLIKLSQ